MRWKKFPCISFKKIKKRKRRRRNKNSGKIKIPFENI